MASLLDRTVWRDGRKKDEREGARHSAKGDRPDTNPGPLKMENTH